LGVILKESESYDENAKGVAREIWNLVDRAGIYPNLVTIANLLLI